MRSGKIAGRDEAVGDEERPARPARGAHADTVPPGITARRRASAWAAAGKLQRAAGHAQREDAGAGAQRARQRGRLSPEPVAARGRHAVGAARDHVPVQRARRDRAERGARGRFHVSDSASERP